MAWYRAYFLNNNRHISDVAEFQSTSDEQAMIDAHALLAKRAYHVAVELWQEARPILLYPQALAAA
jgi:hypothetical protein